jgi:hypothetical protein
MPNALNARKEIGNRREPYTALAKTSALRDLGFQFGRRGSTMSFNLGSITFRRHAWRPILNPAKIEFFAKAYLPSWPHEAFPFIRIVSNLARQ